MRKLVHLVKMATDEQYRKNYDLKLKFMRIMAVNRAIVAGIK
jgi:hypothetical protein